MERINDNNERQAEQVYALSPQEVLERKQDTTPELVLETVNRLLTEKITVDGRARIKQDEIMAILVEGGLNRREIFDKHWLDFEDRYRAAGWEVKYDKPGYNESYDAYFEFRIPKNTVGQAAVSRCVHYE